MYVFFGIKNVAKICEHRREIFELVVRGYVHEDVVETFFLLKTLQKHETFIQNLVKQ